MVEAVLGSVAVDSLARGGAGGGLSVSVTEDSESSKLTCCYCLCLGLEAAPVKLWVEDLRLSW